MRERERGRKGRRKRGRKKGRRERTGKKRGGVINEIIKEHFPKQKDLSLRMK